MTLIRPSTHGALTASSVTHPVRSAMSIANRCAAEALRRHGTPITCPDAGTESGVTTWHDIRPALSTQVHGARGACNNAEAISYLLDAGLAERHPDNDTLIRLLLSE